MSKALVVIDIQNDITKHYRDIIDNINAAIDWAVELEMTVIYIMHNNLSPGTRTFKPNTRGAELAPELKVVSNHIFVKTKANALTSGTGYTVHVIADCVTSYDLKKMPEMLAYYSDKGCEVKTLAEYMESN